MTLLFDFTLGMPIIMHIDSLHILFFQVYVRSVFQVSVKKKKKTRHAFIESDKCF